MPKMTGKRAMVEQLIADGVRHIFGNPGTTEQGFMDILQEYPQVEFMLALHEGVAVCMADAYARLTRRRRSSRCTPRPASATRSGMMHNAADRQDADGDLRRAVAGPRRCPGAAPVRAARGHGEARLQVGGAGPPRPRRAAGAAPRVQDGQEPPFGPVFLSLPMDMLDEEAEVDIEPTTYTHWRGRADAAVLADVARRLLRRASGRC